MGNETLDADMDPDERTRRIAELLHVAPEDLRRAVSLASAAKADGIAHVVVHHLLALGLKEDGRFEEAIVELGLGLKLDANDPRLLTTVGFCLLELGQRQEAAKIFGVAVKLDPASAEASYGYGWAAERLGALASAESGFKRALDLNPSHADAMAGLSGLAARRRDWQTAQDYAERASRLDPRQTDALMNLARVEIGLSRFDAAIERLIAIILVPELKPLARANARLMLGDALDGAGRRQEAFDAYAAGKSDLRRLYAPVYRKGGASAALDGVGRILAEFLETPEEAWRKPSRTSHRSSERSHAFLLGFPRSGTTLLEQILAAHPGVVTLEERPVMIEAEAEFLTRPGGVRRLSGVLSDLLEPYRASYWSRAREFGVERHGKVFVDKHPLSTIRLPLIAKVFPEAKIIFAVRDPRDVVLSCFRRGFNMNASMYEFTSMVDAAVYYDAVMKAGSIYMDKLELPVHQIRYERLVRDFQHTLQGLCDFLGVEWTETLRDFAAISGGRMSATPSSTQVGRGLYAEGVDQWRRYAFALEPVASILHPWVEKYGYSLE